MPDVQTQHTPQPSEAQRWHCTTDHVTEPCGNCDGCRWDERQREADHAQ